MTAEAKLAITAETSGFTKAMLDAQKATTEAVEGIKKQIETLNGAFEKINGLATKLTSILAGGAAFKEIIASTKEWGEGNIQLSKALGISSEKATVYQTALQHLGISNDTIVGASLALSKQIYNNSAAFEKAGIATKESNGQFRSVGDVMQDVAKYLRSIHDPIERNISGIQFFGKAWGEYRSIMKLSNDEMEKAAVRAKELGLATDPETIHEYMLAMRDVNLVITALQNELGKQLLPALTNVALAFKDGGPQGVEVFSALLKGVAYIAGTVAIEFQKMGLWIGKLGAQAAALVNGDFGAIGAIQKDFNNDLTRLNKNADELWDKLNRKPPKAEEEEPEDAGPHDFDSKEKSQSRVGDWQTALEEKKAAYQEAAAAQGQLLEFSKQQEIAYWQVILNTTKTSTEEQKQIRAKIAADEMAIDKALLEGKLATLKNEETEAGKNLAAKLAAEMKYADAVKGVYGTQSKEYAEAQKAILATQQATIEQQQKIAQIQIQSDRDVQLAAINNAEASAKEQFELKRINLQQLIELERKYEEEKYQLTLKAAADELAIVNPNDDPAAYSQRLAQIRQIAAQHQQQLLAIDKTANTEEIALQTKLTNAMSQGFAQAFSGIIKGTETLHKAMTQVYSSILNLVITTLSKMLAQFIATHLVQMIATKEQQTQDAAGGAVAAGKSAAAIPVIGWALSLGAMASFFAAASGYSAEGGYDIPAGINPVTQLHQREMVLPAPIADPLRESLAKGQLGGGGGMTFNVSAMGPRDVHRAMMRGGTLEKAIKDLHRRMKR